MRSAGGARVTIFACAAAALLVGIGFAARPARDDAGVPAVGAGASAPASATPHAASSESAERRAAHAPSASARDRDRETAERLGAVLAIDPVGQGLADLTHLVQRDPDPRVREAAAVALAYTDDPRAVDALIAATQDADTRVVLSAVATLAFSEDRRARATLEALAGSRDRGIAAAAERSLTQL